MRKPLLFLIALCLMPSAAGGTPEAPEVIDPEGDVEIYTFGKSPSQDGLPQAADIISAWFNNETDQAVQFTFQLADLAQLQTQSTSQPGGAAVYQVLFRPDWVGTNSTSNWVAWIDYRAGAWSAYLDIPQDDPGGDAFPGPVVAVMADAATSRIHITLTRAALQEPPPSGALVGVQARAFVYISSPVTFQDYAPDVGTPFPTYWFEPGPPTQDETPGPDPSQGNGTSTSSGPSSSAGPTPSTSGASSAPTGPTSSAAATSTTQPSDAPWALFALLAATLAVACRRRPVR